ncbi:hypothetical protein DGR76_18385 [Escherichia coli]|nr:hypothetical protein CDH88_05390 [Escherichia coli]ASA63911.1 hypothetical protein CDH89_01900 [Escherichia coli]EAC2022395.1 hypothetical protein [Escherichia coli]OWS87232.1 hypothetical protein B7C53_02730 [Escherichia coli]THJ80614.1 hypothetical protein DGR76_18385 [Escherichia coli]
MRWRRQWAKNVKRPYWPLNLRDKAFTPHLATNALPDIKVPENISGIFIPQPNSQYIPATFITSLTTETLIKH